jgi:hypothetical protein
MNEKYAELLGLMAGDGCLSHTGKARYIYIAVHKVDDFQYHTKITKQLFRELFSKEIKINFRKKENALFIQFSDKYIFEELSKYLPVGKKYETLKIPEEILVNKEFLFAFVRGLVDTDGSIIFSKQHRDKAYYPRIEISSKSKEFLLVILSKLRENRFYGSVSHKGKENYRMEIPGHKNLKNWLENIGFNNPTKLKKAKSVPDRIRTGDLMVNSHLL